ncbi:MAG: hypothetical protein IRY97_05590, partial [Thermomicrobiaceae bacterium]|nr:hypothetical protein [Thermomicrobiaceae bacterium]
MIRAVVSIVVATLLLVGCGSSTAQQVDQALKTPQSGPQVSGDTGKTATQATTPTPPPTSTATPIPEPSPTPTMTPTPEPKALALISKGFAQSEYGEVAYAFIVKNPNSGLAVISSEYQVAAYGSDGTVLETDSNYITLLLPGEQVGIAGNLFTPKGSKVDHIDIQIKPGEFESFGNTPNFTVQNVKYVADEYSPKVTGVVQSPYAKDIKDILVSAVAY